MAALEPLEQFLQRPRGLVIGGTERPAAKPTSESLAVDVPLCAELFRYYAGWAPGCLSADQDGVDRSVVREMDPS